MPATSTNPVPQVTQPADQRGLVCRRGRRHFGLIGLHEGGFLGLINFGQGFADLRLQ
jgi:hypothetical protein